jgi:hypothetical protein
MNVKTNANRPSIAALFAGFSKLVKAIPEDKMEDMKDVLDMWNEPGGEHKNPSAAEITTGPAQAAAGHGAEKMIGEYSQPAPQQGMTQQYQAFDGMLRDFGKSFQAQLAATLNPVLAGLQRDNTQIKSFLTGIAQVAKAEEEAKEKEAEEAKKAAATVTIDPDGFLGKAQAKLVSAKSLSNAAFMAGIDGDFPTVKAKLTEARTVLKSATALIAKAMEEKEDPEAECEKAMTSAKNIGKALSKAEDEDKERDEKEAAKAKTAAEAEATAKAAEAEAAAKAAAAGGTADPAAANIAATAAQIKAAGEALTKAAEGNAVLMGNIEMVMKALMGQSQPGGATAPVIQKGTVEPFDPKVRVAAALESQTLSGDDTMKAQQLLQQHGLVKAGRMEQSIFDRNLSLAVPAVQALFAAPAAAAA